MLRIICLVTFLFFSTPILYSQEDGETNDPPKIEEDSGDGGSSSVPRVCGIDGPLFIECGEPAEYTFTVGFDQCSKVKWTILYPDGTESTSSSNPLEIVTFEPGEILIIATVTKCTSKDYYQCFEFIQVGDKIDPITLSGSTQLCNNETSTYTVTAPSNAVNFEYTVPSGWKINGQSITTLSTNSTSIEVTSPVAGSSSGTITVQAFGDDCTTPSNISSVEVDFGPYYPSIALLTPNPTTNSFIEFTAEGDPSLSNFQWTIPSSWSSFDLNSKDLIAISGFAPGEYEVSVSAESCGVSTSDLIVVNVSNLFRSNDGNASARNDKSVEQGIEARMYPNPTQDYLNVEYSGELESLQLAIVDITGNVVKRQNVSKGQTRLNVFSLPKGVYYVKFSSKDLEPFKFLKM